jgi:hypothetical protein
MFEDILNEKKLNMSQLSQRSGVGYNYVFKIIKNQTDFGRCGIETANRLAAALDMDLNGIYAYNKSYFQKKIYYQDQSDWDCQMYGALNAELNKLFLTAIEYHFSPKYKSRDEASCKHADMEISCIRYDRLSEQTKCIMVAILNQQKKMREFIAKYPNLELLKVQVPLKDTLYISQDPYYIFSAYTDMNIAY